MGKEYTIEKEFKYKGFNATIVSQHCGHRCGYVEIPKDHKYFKVHYRDLYDIEVHGGITYSNDTLFDKRGSWFIGFDCMHSGDKKDTSIMSESYLKYYNDNEEDLFYKWSSNITWDLEMVERELKGLIYQL